MSELSWVVYMIECADGSIYTGLTTDMGRRWREHSEVDGPCIQSLMVC
jgi:putative endonuclease